MALFFISKMQRKKLSTRRLKSISIEKAEEADPKTPIYKNSYYRGKTIFNVAVFVAPLGRITKVKVIKWHQHGSDIFVFKETLFRKV